MSRARFIVSSLLVGMVLVVSPLRLDGQRGSRLTLEILNGREVVAGEAIVKFRSAPSRATLAQVGDPAVDEVKQVGRAGAMLLRSRSITTAELLARLRARGDVEYAEPNSILRIGSQPNDPSFNQLWGLHNTGQTIGASVGVPGADIGAVAAWDLTTGSTSHVVAVLDTGIDYNHVDLTANMWSAPTSFTVTVAGQQITCAAGTHGFNVITRSCDPMDDHHHGTHVAGTIGAVGNNGLGVAGVNWTARLMGIKFFDSTGNGTMEDAIAAVEFAIAVKQAFAATSGADIRVLSNSWGGDEFSQALLDEVRAAGDADMLFVAGAGNNGFPNDLFPTYPASFDSPNVIAVAATDNADERAWFSNYGAESVHLAAPGVDILSTMPGGGVDFLSGTSMATPHVSGAAALVLSACEMDTAALKETLLGTVTPLPALAGLTITGGRLQVDSALSACTMPPETPTNLTARPGDHQVSLTWTAAKGALRYNVKRSLVSGGPYITIAADVAGVTYVDPTAVNGTRYYYVVSGQNSLGESGDSNEASAVPNIPPDAVVSALTGPSDIGAGAAVTVSVTTKNQGLGNADPSVTRFYLSPNSSLDATDTPLDGHQSVPALLAGASVAASVSITIPGETATGRYYIIARADDADVLAESVETNNTKSRLVDVGPDLDVSAFVVPSTGAAGATISVTDTTANAGGAGAAATTTTFYLSSNGSLGAGDTPLGSRNVPALSAGGVNSGSTDLIIPATTAVGSYYVIAKADGNDVVLETSETNNSYSRPIKVGSDLVISTLTVTEGEGSNLVLNLSDSTTNEGSGPAEASVTRFYLSSNSSLDGGDTLLDGARAVPVLNPGNSSTGVTTVTIPDTTPAGVYYIIAKADADGVVLETYETNNTLARSVYVGSDLVVSSLTVPSKGGAGSTVSVTDTTLNDGSGAAGASTTRFYLSGNASWDAADTPLNGVHSVPSLAAGTIDTSSTTLTIPAGSVTGTYYVIAKADADNAVGESKETNNTIARSIQIGPDLDVSAFTVPAKGGAGLTLTVSDTTTNPGGGAIGATTMKFYLSVNSALDAGDPVIGSRVVGGLGAGEVSTASTTLTIPVGTTTGSYSVIAKADADNAVTETTETNNTYVRTVKIGPDLTVSTLAASATSAAAGSVVTMTDKITNDGGGNAVPTNTRFYLSPNTSFDASDVPLGAVRAVPALATAAFSTGSTPVTIPTGTTAGRYYIIAKADGDEGLAETSETNNTLYKSIQVTAP